jgi:hypothetical protein
VTDLNQIDLNKISRNDRLDLNINPFLAFIYPIFNLHGPRPLNLMIYKVLPNRNKHYRKQNIRKRSLGPGYLNRTFSEKEKAG